MQFPNIDPILFQVGPFAIRWYALAYVTGILVGWWYAGVIDKKRKPQIFTQRAFEDIVIWIILGIIIGGRLGHVLFYGLWYYSRNPLEIFMIWQGGMAFHGGLIGVIVAIWLFCKKHKLPFLGVMDIVACVVPIGLGLGRIANFINDELYGRVTDVPWAIEFPSGGFLPRHPSQLYEAVLEGLVLFTILWAVVWFSRAKEQHGVLSGLFLIFYATFRMIVELFREPDGYFIGDITTGQALSVPMLLLGVFVYLKAIQKRIPAA